jgi:thiol:disulfide interchange protein
MKLKKLGFVTLVLTCLMLGLLPSAAFSKEIQWQSFANGMTRGKNENKKIYVHFYADWCGACKIMENKTFKDPDIIAYLNENFIPIKVNTDRERQTSTMFRIRLLPDNWFITENGTPIGHQPGYITPEQLKMILKSVMDQESGQ